MTEQLLSTFARCKQEGRAAFVTYLTAGFPRRQDTVPLLLSLQAGGADVIEIGVPFTDPIADGPTIQYANQVALDHGTNSYADCLDIVREARSQGLTLPVVFMGYYNPIVAYGEQQLISDCKAAGVNGFIVVDLPPEESLAFRRVCRDQGLSFVPLIAPTTTDERMAHLCKCADSFIYCVSLTGVTGERTELSADLPNFVARLRANTQLPLAIGFGVSTREHFEQVAALGDGVVIGSAIIRTVAAAAKEGTDIGEAAKSYCQGVAKAQAPATAGTSSHTYKTAAFDSQENDTCFRFGAFGGRYVPETLVSALDELDKQYAQAKADPAFWEEFKSYYQYIGRPSSLHLASRMTEAAGGARIWLKREDLNHTGSHKINNAIGQALLAKRLGKRRIIAETGAGQHGVATATVCAMLDLDLTVYMGAEDVERQALNVFRMELLGAKVVPVESGARTLKDAINEAMRDWVTNITTTHYLIGSVIGPYPFPMIVRDFQSVIGKEAREQMLESAGKLPDYVVACVGGGSNAMGIFHPFINDKEVQLVGVEAGGDGVETGRHSATLSAGKPGVLHGTRTYLLQDDKGQITATHSISAGLDYPGVGPEHAWLKDQLRAQYTSVTDRQALEGFLQMSQLEGIIPALESAHAAYHALKLAKTLPKDKDVLVCVSGRGDKDVAQIRTALPKFGLDPKAMPAV
eukprot:comp24164_c0_seq1/m.44070 comp24164_c0_seq1/g.44070  ORF comp24164_c0_seq1/g.44070 comp24164_c0_seq1/m.44070 type:complete len:690 (-) comp24164_c0_seq1:243-2312(-)